MGDRAARTRKGSLAILVLLAAAAIVVGRFSGQTGRIQNPGKNPGKDAPTQAAQTTSTAPHAHIYFGFPKYTDNDKAALEVLNNKGYVAGYSEAHRNSTWVAYRLFNAPDVKNPRPSGFKVDGRTSARISEKAYTKSGYDRGHLAPNDAIGDCYGPEAQIETFLMSNIIPQRPSLNRKVWARLEKLIAHDWAPRLEEVWVVTGPIFDKDPEKLGQGVGVPKACYKIVVDEEGGRPRMIAFIIPQGVDGSESLERFLTSVDDVEKETGLDFFPEMEKPLQETLESALPSRLW